MVLMTVSRVLNRKIKMPPFKQTKQTNEILIKTEKMADRVPIIEKEKKPKRISPILRQCSTDWKERK